MESAAAAAFRPSAPQIIQPHIVMTRCRQLLIERLLDVYARLLAAGVVEAPLRTQMPDSLPDTAAWAECGIAYFTRHYRVRTGADLPARP